MYIPTPTAAEREQAARDAGDQAARAKTRHTPGTCQLCDRKVKLNKRELCAKCERKMVESE